MLELIKTIKAAIMIEWVKPSGAEVKTNDRTESIAAAEALGWKRKRGRKSKVKVDGNGSTGS